MNIDELRQKINDLDFGIYDETFSDGTVGMELSQYTPMGEDWNFSIEYDGSVESFMENLKEFERNFDVDEEAQFFISQMGVSGIPNDAEGLLEDAKWKKKQLEDLVATLEGANLEECDKVKEEKITEGKLNFIENVDELPDLCYGVLPSDNSIIIIKKGEQGYYPTDYSDMVEGESYDERYKSANDIVNKLNAEVDITPDQRFTMEIRSMNGNWKSKSTECKLKIENRKLQEAITDEVVECAKIIAEEIREVGCMNFTEIQDRIVDIMGISFDKMRDEQIDDDVYQCLNFEGIDNNFGDGDFYTEEYAEEHPEVLEESKHLKEAMASKRPLADIGMAIPFAYDDLIKALDKNRDGELSDEELVNTIKSINTNWDDEDVDKIINDYKDNYANREDKPEKSGDEMEKEAQSLKVKDWYKEFYPDDELGNEIRDNLTFYDLFRTMDRYMNVYTVLGVDDSIVRERVFDKLAEIIDVDYGYIYDQWLMSKSDTTEEEVVEFLKQSQPTVEGKKANGIKGKITEVEVADEEDVEDEEETDELEDLIQEYKDKSPMHEAIIEEIVDDAENYDGETKLDRIIARIDDIFNGPINDGGVSSLIYYSDTNDFYKSYEYDIEDMIVYMQDAGLEPLETLKMNCDDGEIIMQTDSSKYWIVCMVYSEVAYQFQNDLEKLKGE